MGKGKGEKSAFHRFIDDSYFAFWFRQWAAFFIIVGVILIIVGAVVGSQYPKSKETGFAEGQLVTSESDANYASWASKTQSVSYEFLDINSSLSCSLRGPFVYDVTNAKTSVTFFGDGTVSYQISRSKTFRSAESSTDLSSLTTLNPSYLTLVANASGQEFPFLFSAYQDSTINADLEDFFRETVPILIAARGLAQVFPDSIQGVREATVYPTYFNALNKTLTDYEYVYLNNKVTRLTCTYCVGTTATGIYTSVVGAWDSNANCRINPNAGKDQNELKSLLVTAFAALPDSSPCKTYLAAHSFNGSTWTGAGEVALNILNSMATSPDRNINLWYNSTNPSSLGYCHNRAAAQTAFGATAAQINDVCDRFIQLFYNEQAGSVSRADLGARYFCMGPGSSDPSAIMTVLPADFTFSGIPLASMTSATYNRDTCYRLISALSDVSNFVIPAFTSASIPASYQGVISAPEYSTLRAYLLAHDTDFNQWFVSVWRGPANAYGCPSTTCLIRPLAEFADASVFSASSFANLALLFFPSLDPLPVRSYYALTHADPKPQQVVPSLLANITQATGILNRMLRLDRETVKSAYGLTEQQLTQIETYVQQQKSAYLQSLRTANGISGSADAAVGLFQFARAQLACGPSNPTGRCSVATEFYGLSTSYQPEFGIASYNPSTTPVYYRSFVSSDSDLRNTATHTDMSDLFSFLALKTEENLVLSGSADQGFRKYFYFLISTYLRDATVATSSGALAARTPSEWVNGINDPSVPSLGTVSPFFGFDPNGLGSTLKINTGSADIKTAYNLVQIDGSAAITAYPTPIQVATLKNPDAFAPGSISPGDTVPVLDIDLQRPFSYTFGSDDVEVLGVKTKKGAVASDAWAVNAAYGITTANLMPIPYAPISRFYSPCSASFTHTCRFPALEDDPDDLFPQDFGIYSDLKTGLVVRSEGCVIISAQVDGPDGVTEPFPITGKGLTKGTLFSQVRRRSFTQIPASQADAYLAQFNQVDNTATAILLALIIVGALFVVAGIVFLVFYLIRYNRKSHAKSEMDLVDDPFGEKNKNVGSMKY